MIQVDFDTGRIDLEFSGIQSNVQLQPGCSFPEGHGILCFETRPELNLHKWLLMPLQHDS